ncbi:MAG: polysaccharide biosynthesis protein GtrA [Burkholderiales bacterium PBB5]|nr:MAG: polysaccharide biosynthesis protein GtrA [Burkholderiales bacterium PBB5]
MRRLLRLQFVRFVLVGCLNTGFSYALYAVFLGLGLNFALANGLAFVLSLLFSFKTQGALVFRNSNPRLLLRFVLIWGGIYVFNVGVIAGLMRLGLNAYWAGAAALVPVTLLSYLLQRFAVFGSGARPPSAIESRVVP